VSRLSDYLRKRRIDPAHQTRRHLSRYIDKHGFAVGDYTYGCPKIAYRRESKAKLVIGSFCSFADDVEILLGVDHRSDWISTYPLGASAISRHANPAQFTGKGDIVIGSDVWIGTGALILSGVSIGHGAVVGARAVVSRDVAPYSVVAGNPARVVRMRFTDDRIQALLSTRWWTFPADRIRSLLPLLQSPDVDAFLAACKDASDVAQRRPVAESRA
jgi:acetyltransferase-like isoleucine patch superfamily enzyme